MQFSHPMLLALAVLVPWAAGVGRREDLSRSTLITRLAVGFFLVIAIAGLRVRVAGGPVNVVFVLDRSASIPPVEQSRSLARVSRLGTGMRPNDQAAVVLFGADAVIDQTMAARSPVVRSASQVNAQGTNIEAALRVARAVLPSEGTRRIVLVSDGQETAGDARREAAIARDAGVRIDVLPVSIPKPAGLRVNRIEAPLHVRIGEPYTVTAEISGAPGASDTITWLREGAAVRTTDVTADTFGTARVSIEDRQQIAGAAVYTAQNNLQRTSGESSDSGAVVIAAGLPAVLYAAGDHARIDRTITAAEFVVSRVVPAALPTNAAGLAPFSAVVLDDVPAESLSDLQNRALAAYVEKQGGGLLVLGTPRSLGPAGYPGTPLGATFPVDLRKKTGARAPDAALVVVFDKSGSMADATRGVTKIELARRAVMSVLEAVPASDSIGVIAFDTTPITVAPLQAGHAAATLQERLRSIEPGGSTLIAPAIEAARAALRTSSVARRRILLLTDGRSAPSDATQLLALARARDVEWSIVAIGSDVDRQLFEQLARESGGRAYFPADLTMLPDVLAREAARAAGGWRVRERFILRARGAHPVLAGIRGDTLPTLDSYVAATTKPTASTILGSHLDDPVFAAWRVGLGRVAVFTADMSPPFRAWNGFAPLWQQTVRWIGRGHEAGELDASVESTDGKTRLVVDVRTGEGQFANNLRGEVAVRDPGDRVSSAPLRQFEPGRYEASIDTRQKGAYLASISMHETESSEEFRTFTGLYWRGAAESRPERVDRDRLIAIAQSGGGAELSDNDNPFSGPRAASYRDFSWWFALVAALLYLGEIALRRGVLAGVLRTSADAGRFGAGRVPGEYAGLEPRSDRLES
jgi:Mg-chelatase subunit ChlD